MTAPPLLFSYFITDAGKEEEKSDCIPGFSMVSF